MTVSWNPELVAGRIPKKKYRYSIVACARWEENDVNEWIEYHQSIGFDHIYLYSNDDDPTVLFSVVAPYAVGDSPFVTLFHWPIVGDQIGIYLHFLHNYKDETEWFSFLDIDEFFVIKYLNNISLFMESYKSVVDCLYFNWIIYGNSGRIHRENIPILTSYCQRAAGVDRHTKMICRSEAIDAALLEAGLRAGKGAFWHFLDNYRLPDARCRDILLAPTDGYSSDFPKSAGAFALREGYTEAVIERAYVAHFQFKSEEDFLRRWRRGGFDNGDAWKNAYESGVYMSILTKTNEIHDTYLSDYWKRQVPQPASQTRFTRTSSGLRNLALKMPSRQSSVYQPVSKEPDGSVRIGFATNGIKTGTYGFHTDLEDSPWWILDLLIPCAVSEIRIYNRMDHPALAARASGLTVLASVDNVTWTQLFEHKGTELFGVNGSPLTIPLGTMLTCRFLKVHLNTTGYLHLDEVEVYGQALGAPAPTLLSSPQHG
jgi:hypothetical protein